MKIPTPFDYMNDQAGIRQVLLQLQRRHLTTFCSALAEHLCREIALAVHMDRYLITQLFGLALDHAEWMLDARPADVDLALGFCQHVAQSQHYQIDVPGPGAPAAWVRACVIANPVLVRAKARFGTMTYRVGTHFEPVSVLVLELAKRPTFHQRLVACAWERMTHGLVTQRPE